MRHGQSTWNEQGRVQGQLDPSLSELGSAQAEALVGRLGQQLWAGFYSSDLARCRETAAPLAAQLGVEPVLMPELREIFLGQWEGLTRQEMASRYPSQWARWMAEPDWDVVPGGEGTGAFERRVEAALDVLLSRHPTGDILAITHGGVVQVLLARVLGRAPKGPFPFVVANASVTVLERRRGSLLIGRVNDTCHLEALRITAAPEPTLPR